MRSLDDVFQYDLLLAMQAQQMGQNHNYLQQQLRKLPRSLFDAYVKTTFSVTMQDVRYVLRVGQALPGDVNDILIKHGAKSISIITAWNPLSEELAEQENNERQALLKDVIEMNGLAFHPAIGISEDERWEEPSFAVLDTSMELAESLGRVFGQNAVVYAEVNGFVQLIPTL